MSDVSYKPIIEKFTWSFSRIQAYKSCKWKFFLRYIRGWRETKSFFSSYGSFMHELIERFYKGEIDQEEAVMEFLTRYKTEVRGQKPSNVSGLSYIEKALEYLKNLRPSPYEVIAVEKQFFFDIDGIPFTGIVDRIEDRDGKLYIIDNKSRDLKPRSGKKKPTVKDKELDEMLLQLYVYAIAVEKEFGKLPSALCFDCFKNGVFIEEPFDQDKFEEAKQWVIESVKEIEDNEDWDSSEFDYFQCNYLCGLHNKCEIYLEETG